jgi:DNA-directed RNA polymerase alpha subunit
MVEQTDWFAVPLEALGLSGRVLNCVRTTGARTVGEICQVSIDEILTCRSFGMVTITELERQLAALGLRLRDDKAGACVVRTKREDKGGGT